MTIIRQFQKDVKAKIRPCKNCGYAPKILMNIREYCAQCGKRR